MRADMNKVVGERYRRGRRLIVKPGRTPQDSEDLAPRMGMRRGYVSGWGRAMKESSLHTTPLSRFIEMQVGRSWNTVYSEICAIFDSRKQANAAAFNLLDWRVTTRGLFMHEGNVLEHSPYRAPVSPLGLYVHPLTGLLCRNVYVSRMKRYKAVVAAREVEKAQSEKTLSPTQKLIKDKGCWFLVDYAVVLAPQYGMNAQPRICRDVLTGEEFTKVRPSRTGNIAMYARAKRQLSKKEMKKFGVR